MPRNNFPGRILRITAMVLMGLTTIFTLSSGAGTTCVALAAENWESMASIAPFKWIYMLFVLVTLGIGVMGVRALLMMIKGLEGDYRFSVLTLCAGIAVGVVHMVVSRSLRGKSMPVDVIVYWTVLTLLVFVVLRLPGIWEKVEAVRKTGRAAGTGSGMAAMLSGAAVLTVQYWAGPSHTMNGVNYADAWHSQLAVLGWGLCLLGGLVLIASVLSVELVLRPWRARLTSQ